MIHTYKVLRHRTLPNAGSRTLFFTINAGTRCQPTTFFRPGEIPEFDGEEAWFEAERNGTRWRFIRQVEKPRWER